AGQSKLGTTLQLLTRVIDVVDVQHADPLEPPRSGPAEIRDPRVVRSTKRGEQLAVRDAIPEETLARLEARAPDTIHLELLQHRVRIVGRLPDVLPHAEKVDGPGILEAAPRLDHGADRPDAHAIQVPRVVLLPGPGAMTLHARSAAAEFRLDQAF